MTPSLQANVSLLSRFLISVIFLLSGITKIVNWSGTADYMASHGMPAIPFMLTMAIVAEVLGGLALLLGFQTRISALLLFLYLIPTTLIFHNFWSFQGLEQHNQMIHFLKNVAIMGGLLEFFAVGAGARSLDASLTRPSFGSQFWPGSRRPI